MSKKKKERNKKTDKYSHLRDPKPDKLDLDFPLLEGERLENYKENKKRFKRL